jgi:hypothetical protein
MKNYSIISGFFMVLICTAFSSCIKQKCEVIQCGPHRQFSMGTKGFSENEIQTVHLRKFVKGSNFTQLISTSVIKNNENTVSIRASEASAGFFIIANSGNSFSIESSFDYEFYVPATNTVRKLSEITDIQEQMNYCRPSLQRPYCNNSQIKSCRLDGVLTEGYIPAFQK